MSVALVALVTTANAQDFPNPKKSNYVDIGGLAGYNLDTKGPVYGGGIGYEYRPVQNWGFVANLNYDFTRTDEPNRLHLQIPDIAGKKAKYWGQEMYSASLGARYYIKRFFVGASFGLAYEKNWGELEGGSRTDTKTRYGFYQNYYAGYQIPLKDNSCIEIIANASGAGSLKTTIAGRYKFGF